MGGITNNEIDRQCDYVAIELSIPIAWVRHHVDAKCGKPCPKCGGSGRWQGGYRSGSCYQCSGTGGKATPKAVQDALLWVQANVDKVKTLGASRDARRANTADKKAADKQVELEARQQADQNRFQVWADENPRHAWALENMEDGEFKESLTQAAHRGWMSEPRMVALWKEADKLELRARGDTKPAPEKGTVGDFIVVITDVDFEHANSFGEYCIRVDFKSLGGWRGRLETKSAKVEAVVKERPSNEVLV
ncbi:MAG: hypothetical protein E4H44_06265, partial [Candidatus Aminicenantes bacterium]